MRYSGLFLTCAAFDLTVDGIDACIDSLLKRVGDLGGDHGGYLRHADADHYLLVHDCLGLYDAQFGIELGDVDVVARQTFRFLLYEGG